MTDFFKKHARGLSSPAENAVSIVPDDAADLAVAPRALFVGQSGDLAVVMLGGATVTFGNVPAGSLLPLRVARVCETGTTADGIIGLW